MDEGRPARVHHSELDGERLNQIDAAVRLTDAIDGVVAVTSELTAPPPANWPGAGYHIPA